MEKLHKYLTLFVFYFYVCVGVLIPALVSNADIDKSIYLPFLKVAIINSYDIEHVSGTPQMRGIINEVIKLDKQYQVDIQVWYMKSSTTYCTQEKVDYISKKIIDDVDKFNPDYIFVIDDAAFKNVGIPLSDKHKIFFSGINKPFINYKNDIVNIDSFSGVEENIPLDGFFKIMSKIEFYPSKIWIITDSSTTSFFLTHAFKSEISTKTNFQTEILVVNNISDLRRTLSSIQSKDAGIIFFTFQNLIDEDYKVSKSKRSLIKDILKYNKKHLEVCENTIYSKMGVGFSVSPDFYKMGMETGKLLTDSIHTSIWKNKVSKSDNIISINIKRLEELQFKWVYKKIIEEVDYSYATF